MHASQVILISLLTSVITAGSTVVLMERLKLTEPSTAAPDQVARILVPQLQGLPEADARANLAAAGLLTLLGPRKPSDQVAPGLVSEQMPPAGLPVERGTTVSITLAAPLPEVPSVLGQPQDEARAALEKAGYKSDFGEPLPDTKVPEGSVTSQVPKPGETVKPGTTILLRLSSGPAPVAVPKVTGLNVASAKQNLREAGLELGKVAWVFDPDLFPNAVLRQDPAAGSQAKPGSPVNVTVNRE